MRELAGDVAQLSAEQLDVRNTLRSFLARQVDEQAVRVQVQTKARFDRAVWRRMAAELGIVGMAVPEKRGGYGAGPMELVVVAESLGQALAPQPFLATAVLAAQTLARVESTEADELLADVIDGESVVAVVVPAFARGVRPRVSGLRATGDTNTVRIDGSAEFVINGAQADRLLVHVDVTSVPTLVLVDRGAQVEVDDRPTLDETRAQASIRFAGAAGTVLAAGDLALACWRHAETLAQLALAAEDVAVARRCLELSVDYAGVRSQFGRLIGSYQAIKHKTTDMLIAVDLARAAVVDAASALHQDRPDADAAVAMARHLGQVAAELATRECIQIHGGIGFTWEHSAHLYFKRARGNAAIFSSPGVHLDAYADHVLAPHPRSSR